MCVWRMAVKRFDIFRQSLKFQYSALDSGNGTCDRTPRERACRERAMGACQDWMKNSQGRYEIIAHLDEIGCRNTKNWFLLNDATIRTERLMTLQPIAADCVALDETLPSESPKGVLMELLGSLQHPYIYPVLDLGFLHTHQTHYACLVMPFNARGSLKDLIYKVIHAGLLPLTVVGRMCDPIVIGSGSFEYLTFDPHQSDSAPSPVIPNVFRSMEIEPNVPFRHRLMKSLESTPPLQKGRIKLAVEQTTEGFPSNESIRSHPHLLSRVQLMTQNPCSAIQNIVLVE